MPTFSRDPTKPGHEVRRGRAVPAACAFAAGWCVMSLEILNGRLMAPAFGQTTYQWGALIGTALLFMAAGYWRGGAMAALPGARRRLAALFGLAALAAALTPWAGGAVCALADAWAGPLAGAVLASAALLGPPAFALAAASPLCVAWAALPGAAGAGGDAAAAGRAAALCSAAGALGSIGGTFFAAFAAVPALGLSAGYASAAAVAAAGALACGLAPARALLALAPLAGAALAERAAARGFLEVFDTPYNRVMVARRGDATAMFLNSPLVVQSVRREGGGPTGLYYDALPAVPALAAGGARDALFLGVAGGAGIEAVGRAWPDLRPLGVEIDAGVVAAARRHFGLRAPVAVEDARRYVQAGGKSFGVVVVDLYATGQMPAHTVTAEFFAALKRRVAPGGVVAVNVLGGERDPALAAPLAATLRTAFPSVLAADASASNGLLLAFPEPVSAAEAARRLQAAPPAARAAAGKLIASLREAGDRGERPWTDERSDVELRSARMMSALRAARPN